jgi:hypothetical protein
VPMNSLTQDALLGPVAPRASLRQVERVVS